MKIERSRFDRLPTIDPIQVGRPRLKLKNPVLAQGTETLDYSYYGFFSVALHTSWASKLSLFQQPVGSQYTPVGGTAFNLSLLHTNMEGTGGMFPNGYKEDVQALRVAVDGGIQYIDLNNLLFNTLFTFKIGQKEYAQMPLHNFPGGIGAYLSAAPDAITPATGNATTFNGPANCNGAPMGLRGVYSFSAGLEATIAYGQNFKVDIDPTLSESSPWSTQQSSASPAGVGIRGWAYLDGVVTRPTQ